MTGLADGANSVTTLVVKSPKKIITSNHRFQCKLLHAFQTVLWPNTNATHWKKTFSILFVKLVHWFTLQHVCNKTYVSSTMRGDYRAPICIASIPSFYLHVISALVSMMIFWSFWFFSNQWNNRYMLNVAWAQNSSKVETSDQRENFIRHIFMGTHLSWIHQLAVSKRQRLTVFMRRSCKPTDAWQVNFGNIK